MPDPRAHGMTIPKVDSEPEDFTALKKVIEALIGLDAPERDHVIEAARFYFRIDTGGTQDGSE